MSAAAHQPVPDGWVDNFFDSGFEATSRLLGKYDSTEQELADLTELLGLRPGQRILDVPCGFGRHSGPLSRRGFSVAGIDISPHQIAEARRRWPSATFHLQDMRNPPPGPFDFVLNLWTSFGYLSTPEDDLAALIAWQSVLVPGGRLLMELSTLEQAMRQIRTTEAEAISTKRVRHGDLQEDSWFDWTSQLAHVRYSRPGWSRGCRTRMYSRSQLRSALLAAGFNDVRMMGDLRGGPVDDDHRTVVIASN
ncbi:hypothetical protein GCM10010441_29380 [Kitasatospora paracochleata]|uniref:SAM-dependent methyltransferase n=1 Tax=Kitasatospora paracochleata TaxID=58354 RepID=A0ABT1J8Y1_9ACTN|nr:class I SAM-dependent methyltransferase [Kitasatospora paracochleata]MCP2313899.1 SAM-dependent methyltransferase [Kitasatospora paracochleata]